MKNFFTLDTLIAQLPFLNFTCTKRYKFLKLG